MGCRGSKPAAQPPSHDNDVFCQDTASSTGLHASTTAAQHYSHPEGHIGLDIDSLRELLVLIEDYNRGRPESEWIVTTADAANKLVKVKTAGLPDGEAAWVNLLAPKHVGIPDVFVSHTWRGKIVPLLQAVIAEAEARPPTAQPEMYYFDMASVDQQKTDQAAGNAAISTAVLHEMFTRLIAGCNRLLVVVTPYDGPIVTSRLWCLFEVCTASRTNTPTVVVLSPAEKAALQTRMVGEGGHDVMIEVMLAVSSAAARATVPEDEQNLREFIQTRVDGGFEAVDEIFKGALRKWIVATAKALIERPSTGNGVGGGGEPTRSDGTLAVTAGLILNASGDPAAAVSLYETALRIYTAVHGADDTSDAAAVYANLGAAYEDMGEPAKAVELYTKALAIMRKTIGEEHPTIAITYTYLGNAYGALGEPTKAVEVYTKALAIQRKTIGEEHPSIAITYNNLGGAYAALGEPSKAVELYTKALAMKRKTIGEAHPSIAITYWNLGYAYEGLGEPAKAVELYTKALAILRKTVGNDHPDYHAVHNYLTAAQAKLP